MFKFYLNVHDEKREVKNAILCNMLQYYIFYYCHLVK
jgi:hypothetical protein